MFQKKHSAQRMMVAAVAAVGLMFSAMADRAHAFSFSDLTADVVVALYGNDNEVLYNLGTFADVFASGSHQTLNVDLAAASGPNPVRFAVFGSDLLGERIWGGTTIHQASLINRGNVSQSTQMSALNLWAPQSSFPGNVIAASNPNSFSSRIDLYGGSPPNFGGAWPTNTMFGNVGDILSIFETGEGDGNLNFVGSAQLVAGVLGGQLIFGNPGPIPVPAAVVLFGSGLIGLVGMARRSLSRVA